MVFCGKENTEVSMVSSLFERFSKYAFTSSRISVDVDNPVGWNPNFEDLVTRVTRRLLIHGCWCTTSEITRISQSIAVFLCAIGKLNCFGDGNLYVVNHCLPAIQSHRDTDFMSEMGKTPQILVRFPALRCWIVKVSNFGPCAREMNVCACLMQPRSRGKELNHHQN